MKRFIPLLLATGCMASTGEGSQEELTVSNGHANVIRRIVFPNQISPGVAFGFDLDGLNSEFADPGTCNQRDFVDPNGVKGIDNQLAKVWNDIEPVLGPVFRDLLLGAINEGRMLILIELDGLDDPKNDVTVKIMRGQLEPEVGTFGTISPDQTFGIDSEFPIVTVPHGKVVDGQLEVGPFDYYIPLDILEADFTVKLREGRIRLKIAEDGTFSGMLAGSFHVQEVLDELYKTDAAEDVKLAASLFEDNVDTLYSAGKCTGFSAAFEFEGTTAFIRP